MYDLQAAPGLENKGVGVDGRFEDVRGDERQRFRLLNTLVGGMERRLVR